MRTFTFSAIGMTILTTLACGGGGGGGSSSSTPPAPTVMVSGVVEGSGSSLSMNQKPMDFSKASLTIDGQAADSTAVRPGMPITGSAADQQGVLVVAQAQSHAELKGPLDLVDHDTLRVLGQPVRITSSTLLVQHGASGEAAIQLQDLRPNDSLRVFGVRTGGVLEGTRVERSTSSASQVELRGAVQNLDIATFVFFVNGTKVDYHSAKVSGALAAGVWVEVQGSLAAGVVVADHVEVIAAQAAMPLPQAELHGTISALDTTAKTFLMLGITIDYKTAVVEGTLANGRWAEVHAVQTPGQPAGQLTATHVNVESPHPPASGKELEGTIDFLDTTAGIVGVGGIRFWIDKDTTIFLDDKAGTAADLKLGLKVEIHYDPARTNPAGQAYAFRIEIDVEDETAAKGVEGTISGFDAIGMQFTLDGVTIKTTLTTEFRMQDQLLLPAVFWGTSRNGARAEAVGTLTGTTLTATRIELK